jgi:CubicO group peptidase (beta-lactamase class C family)
MTAASWTDVLAPLDSWAAAEAAVEPRLVVLTGDGVVAGRGPLDAPGPIASVSKLLTGYAVVIAVSEGAVDLSTPAGPPGATLRHLLAHTAGYGFDSDAAVLAPPGARRIYSNRGIEEAAAAVERATGIPFATYLTEAVLDPLGMVRTDPSGSPAHGYTSTAADLAAFADELLRPRLLDPGTLTGAVAVAFPGLDGVVPGVGRFAPCDWGLSFERNFGRSGHWTGDALSRSTFGHFGGTGSFLWVDPDRGLAATCLSGRNFGPWAMAAWPSLCAGIVAATPGPTAPSPRVGATP